MRRILLPFQMQNNRILNLPSPDTGSSPVTKGLLDTTTAALDTRISSQSLDLSSQITAAHEALDLIQMHPWLRPSASYFTHFLGGIGELAGDGAPLANAPMGVWRLTRPSGRTGIRGTYQSLLMGQTASGGVDWFRARVAIEGSAWTSSNNSIVRMGFINSDSSFTTGIIFTYNLNNTPYWRALTSINGTQNAVITTALVDFNSTYHDFAFKIMPGGSSINFLYDGQTVATITTNIPKSVGQELGPWIGMLAGSSSSTNALLIDSLGFGVQQIFD